MKKILLIIFLSTRLLSQAASGNSDKKDALALYRAKKYDEAIAITKSEISKNPDDVDSYVVLGWSFLAKKDYKNAIDWSNKILETYPDDARIIDVVGESYYNLKDYKNAIDNFKRFLDIIGKGPKSMTSDVYYYLGLCYLKNQQLLKAKISFQASSSFKENKDLKILLMLGYVYERLNQQNEALKYYKKILALDSSYKEAQYGIIRLES